jgi:hypothetical protein
MVGGLCHSVKRIKLRQDLCQNLFLIRLSMFYLTLHEGGGAGRKIAFVAFPSLGGWMTLFERRDDAYGREASTLA